MGIVLLSEPVVYPFTWLRWLKKRVVNYGAGTGLNIQGQEPFESALLMELFM